MTYQFQLNADGSTCMPFVTKGIAEVFGIDAKTVKHDAAAVFALLHPDDLESVWQSIRGSAQHMSDWVKQFRVMHPKKGEIWVEGHATPEQLADGAFLWHGFIRNITDRKHAEQTLQNSESRFRQMFEHAPVAYQSLDIDGCYLEVNNKTTEMLGYSREELLGRYSGDFWIEPDKEQFPVVFDNFKTTQHVGSELRLRRKDGNIITTLVDGRIQRDSNGNFVRTHCILWDISERKQMEEMLVEAKITAENASHAKSNFLSQMSHELRTPLNAIIGFAQLLELDELAPLADEQKEAIEHIMLSSRQLLSLINETLDLARIESGNMKLNIENIELEAVNNDVLSLMRPVAALRQIDITHSGVGQERVFVRADALRLKQVLQNLLSNAIKYNRPGGKVSLSCAITGANIRITVADTGLGISDQYRTQIFQSFQRLGAEKTTIEGTGIGLVICKQLVEAMGGNIGFDSTVGIGSQFWFELPVLVSERKTALEAYFDSAANASNAGTQAKSHVLYIEDSPVNVSVMMHVFRQLPDIELISAEDAETGLALISQKPPDLVLMDINLPGISGLEALRRLKSNPVTASIPVIAVSAAARPADVEAGLEAGFLAYLVKPFNIPELIHLITETLLKTSSISRMPIEKTEQ